MYTVSIRSEGAVAEFDAAILAPLRWKGPDLKGLEGRIRSIVQDQNKEDRLEGVDREGGHLIGLAPSTLKKRKGSPIPFVEHGVASRVIANLIVHVEASPGRLQVQASWLAMPWLKYHITGGPVIPKRDFAGFGPWVLPLIDAAVVAESDRQFPGFDRGFSGGTGGGIRH